MICRWREPPVQLPPSSISPEGDTSMPVASVTGRMVRVSPSGLKKQGFTRDRWLTPPAVRVPPSGLKGCVASCSISPEGDT